MSATFYITIEGDIVDLLKISNFIDNFFEQKNGELKFSRKLVNKEYAKKIDADYYAKDAKSSVEIAKLTF